MGPLLLMVCQFLDYTLPASPVTAIVRLRSETSTTRALKMSMSCMTSVLVGPGGALIFSSTSSLSVRQEGQPLGALTCRKGVQVLFVYQLSVHPHFRPGATRAWRGMPLWSPRCDVVQELLQ